LNESLENEPTTIDKFTGNKRKLSIELNEQVIFNFYVLKLIKSLIKYFLSKNIICTLKKLNLLPAIKKT
jgi:hypothetical protein